MVRHVRPASSSPNLDTPASSSSSNNTASTAQAETETVTSAAAPFNPDSASRKATLAANEFRDLELQHTKLMNLCLGPEEAMRRYGPSTADAPTKSTSSRIELDRNNMTAEENLEWLSAKMKSITANKMPVLKAGIDVNTLSGHLDMGKQMADSILELGEQYKAGVHRNMSKIAPQAWQAPPVYQSLNLPSYPSHLNSPGSTQPQQQTDNPLGSYPWSQFAAPAGASIALAGSPATSHGAQDSGAKPSHSLFENYSGMGRDNNKQGLYEDPYTKDPRYQLSPNGPSNRQGASLYERYSEDIRNLNGNEKKASLLTKALNMEGKDNSLKVPEAYTQPFCEFLTENPTVFHTVDHFEKKLSKAGFIKASSACLLM
jgi:hypothetical protein